MEDRNPSEATGQAASVDENQRIPLSTSNGHRSPVNSSEATPSRRLIEPSDHSETGDDSRPSPASALADLLSSLELSTPAAQSAPDQQSTPQPSDQRPTEAHAANAANGHAPSKPEAGTAEATVGAQHPRKAQAGDVAVGLVYDPLMEDHTGPPGEPAPSQL